MANPRAIAVDVLCQFEAADSFLSELLAKHLSSDLTKEDRALCSELVYGTVRMQKRLDYFLKQFSKRKIEALDPKVRAILRSGAYQIMMLDRVPARAAINESVSLGKKYFHQGVGNFVNGVLRNLERSSKYVSLPDKQTDPISYISVNYSLPEWLVKLWLEWLGLAETEALCEATNERPSLAIRVNTLKTSIGELSKELSGRGVQVSEAKYAPDVLVVHGRLDVEKDPLFSQGHYYVQDEGSALVAHAVDPQPKEIIYDLCSAPGGKSTHLAQLMQNQGRVVALDKYGYKLLRLQENVKRLGIDIIDYEEADATRPLELGVADRVLIDAPCSGLGVIRHKPDIKWRLHPEDLTSLISIQTRILDNAAKLVKPRGLLVYSTCTINPGENQQQIEQFLRKHQDFRFHPLPQWFPTDNEGFFQGFPHKHGIDGFFIAVLEKFG